MTNAKLHSKQEAADGKKIDYCVIFGAAVLPGGKPSGTLKRRVQGALALASDLSNVKFLVTGGKGRFEPSEAQVMRDLLVKNGVSAHDIMMEPYARDTLDSVYFCRDILNSIKDDDRVFVCSSPYHNLRCFVLFRMIGINAMMGKMPSDRPALGWRKWIYYCIREAAALPWDMLVILYYRVFGRQRTPNN